MCIFSCLNKLWFEFFFIGLASALEYDIHLLRIIFFFHERGLFLPCVTCTSHTAHVSITFCCILSFIIIKNFYSEPFISFELLFFWPIHWWKKYPSVQHWIFLVSGLACIHWGYLLVPFISSFLINLVDAPLFVLVYLFLNYGW